MNVRIFGWFSEASTCASLSNTASAARHSQTTLAAVVRQIANILFAVAFDRRHRGRGVRAAAVHPGVIETELARHVDPARIQTLIGQIRKERAAEGQEPFQWKTVPQGAATSVWAAVVAPAEEIGGKYCENCHVGEVVADSAPMSGVSEGVRGYALDPNNAEALWKKSEEMVGERF
jgi:NAD(P)-dependent dehydrogenase (short-subunit alcohol dehydrogenase family)